jgi:ubiquinone/menaquinone biosynthesis C-methylase UbiE
LTDDSSLGYKLSVNSQPASLREAFNRHALTYDASFSRLRTAQEMRHEIWRVADGLFPSGSRLLDLGCGTGEDAIHFARNGVVVTAIDIAPGMIAQVRMKAHDSGLSERVNAKVADIQTFEPEIGMFDGIFSNFGAINCVRRLTALRDIAARALKPHAPLLLVTMGRFYPFESLVFLLKGDVRRAFVRLKREPEANIEGVPISLSYYSPRELRAALGHDFSLEQLRGLRSLVPSPSLEHISRFLPMRFMRRLDSVATKFRPTAPLADHYISVWRRQ